MAVRKSAIGWGTMMRSSVIRWIVTALPHDPSWQLRAGGKRLISESGTADLDKPRLGGGEAVFLMIHL